MPRILRNFSRHIGHQQYSGPIAQHLGDASTIVYSTSVWEAAATVSPFALITLVSAQTPVVVFRPAVSYRETRRPRLATSVIPQLTSQPRFPHPSSYPTHALPRKHISAEVSIIPASFSDRRQRVKAASNATPICTSGQRSLTLDLGLRRTFQALFWVAEVRHSIIGAEFVQKFRLLVGMSRRRVVDQTTLLACRRCRGCYLARLSSVPRFTILSLLNLRGCWS